METVYSAPSRASAVKNPFFRMAISYPTDRASSEKRRFPGNGFTSFELRGNQFGHFKHGYLFFTPKNRLQFPIGIDHAPIVFILQIVLFYVIPYFFCHFSCAAQALHR